MELSDLVPVGWQLTNANGINDAGQIAGAATDPSGVQRIVRLDPVGVPEPGTWLLAAAGLVIVARRAGRISSEGHRGRNNHPGRQDKSSVRWMWLGSAAGHA